MARSPIALRDISDNINQVTSSIVDLTNKISVPYTSIVNRAQIPDLSQDLSVNMGVNRIMTQQIYQIQNEFGPNGKPVYGVVNDTLGLIRFVGGWSQGGLAVGQYQIASTTSDYVEISFYGTGLDVLISLDSSSRDMRVTIDGGTEGSNLVPASLSSVLNGRNYSPNQILNVSSGLSLGVHTVKLRNNNASANIQIFGFEILNESTSLKVNPGSYLSQGRRLKLSAQQTLAYNSGFESGVLGTRGGHVLVYQKSDRSVAKAVTPTNSSAAYLTNADHTNEDLIRGYSPREFGAGRSDDFSTLMGSLSSRAFTLDDGTTTLTCANCNFVTIGGREGLQSDNVSAAVTFTFVGSGFDIFTTQATTTTTQIYVDGTSIGSGLTFVKGLNKIASGLPHGTHTVKFVQTNGGSLLTIAEFRVYGPKQPALPAGAEYLADYYVMADFAANATAGVETLATGVLRKVAAREQVYVNGTGGSTDWTITLTTGSPGGFDFYTDKLNAYVEYTFFGTGFDLRKYTYTNCSSDSSVYIDGHLLSTAGFSINGSGTPTYGTVTQGIYGTGFSFTAATGVINANAAGVAGVGFWVNGLSLGVHKVRFINNTSGSSNFLSINTFDIITPIHSPKSNLLADLQNTLSVGSQSIGDLRKLTSGSQAVSKNWAQAVGVTSDPTTTSTSFVPATDMSLTIKTTGNPLEIAWEVNSRNSNTAYNAYAIFVDGVAVNPSFLHYHSTTGASYLISDKAIVPVGAGVHKVDLYWKVFSGTGQLEGTNRRILAKELP